MFDEKIYKDVNDFELKTNLRAKKSVRDYLRFLFVNIQGSIIAFVVFAIVFIVYLHYTG